MRLLLPLLILAMAPGPALAECTARSGERTAALVELYTSEGCSSCPPADRWLSALSTYGGRVVPLSLHVDYWDYIGWKDPYAKGEFSSRQRKMTQLQRRALVYTPQVLLQGQEFRSWGDGAFDEALKRINAQIARASISLKTGGTGGGVIPVEAAARLLDGGQKADMALYVAAYENKLVSQVKAGENEGRRLAHDYVVLEWRGPFAFGTDGLVAYKGDVPLLPKAVPANSGVAAFVQNRRTAEVLQALMLPACRN